MNLREEMEKELKSELKALALMEVGSDQYRVAMDGITKLAESIRELEKLEREAEMNDTKRLDELTYKEKQLQQEKKKDWMHIGIEVGKFAGYAALYFITFVLSTNFERFGSFTTEGGKDSVRSLFKMKP